jgi:hypothetical protein
MAYFQTENPNLGKFWKDLQWKTSILWTLGLFYGHLAYFVAIWQFFMVIWYIFPVLVCCTKKNLATLFQTAFSRTLKGYLCTRYTIFILQSVVRHRPPVT